ncbi:MAG: hypothetical protein ACK484_05770 [Sphingobacteriales bacterium]
MWSSGIDIIQAINNRWELALQPSITEEELVQALAARINHLIVHDFPRLIHILYVIDVSEEKLKKLLRTYKDSDAGVIIAKLVVDRQKKKAINN